MHANLKTARAERRIAMKAIANLTRCERVGADQLVFPPATTSLVNLTGRMIVLCTPGGEPLCAFPPSDRVARAKHVITQSTPTQVNGVHVPLYHDTLRLQTDLPDPRPGVKYIVDYGVVLTCTAGGWRRQDLLVPNGPTRDETANVLHVASFAIAGLQA
jgi:hypothetical protein